MEEDGKTDDEGIVAGEEGLPEGEMVSVPPIVLFRVLLPVGDLSTLPFCDAAESEAMLILFRVLISFAVRLG